MANLSGHKPECDYMADYRIETIFFHYEQSVAGDYFLHVGLAESMSFYGFQVIEMNLLPALHVNHFNDIPVCTVSFATFVVKEFRYLPATLPLYSACCQVEKSGVKEATATQVKVILTNKWAEALARKRVQTLDEIELNAISQLAKLNNPLKSSTLVVCDEFGYISCDKEGAELLFYHLSLRAGRKSTIIGIFITGGYLKNALREHFGISGTGHKVDSFNL